MFGREAIGESVAAALLPVIAMGAAACVAAALLLMAAVFAAGILKQANAR